MKPIMLMILVILVSGCGNDSNNAPATAVSAGGAYFDSSVYTMLDNVFEDVKKCMADEGFPSDKGSTADLTIVMMWGDTFDCVDPVTNKPTRCTGEFISQGAIIKVTHTFESVRHEYIHFLLEKNTGDLDPAHKHATLFQHCQVR